MNRSYIILGIILYLSLPGVDSYAAYVGDPSRVFTKESGNKDYGIFAEGIGDIIYDRGAKFQADDMEVEFYGVSAGLLYKDICMVYGGLGTAKVQERFVASSNADVRWESDYAFTWLAGLLFKLYSMQLDTINSRLLFSVDTQYRNAYIEPDRITIDSVAYRKADPQIPHSSMEYNDWHVAAAVSLDTGAISPYAGIKYSDFESCARVMRDGILLEKDNAEADDNMGVFLGISLKIADRLYASLEASFIDEEAFSGSVSLHF